MRKRALPLLFLGLSVGAACTRDNVVPPMSNPDGGAIFVTPDYIKLDKVLSPTPLDTVKVSGTSSADHIIIRVRGTMTSVTAQVLAASRAFCVDVPIPKGQQVMLETLGLDGKGGYIMGDNVWAAQDSSVPAPPGATCSGLKPGCNTREICNNDIDDNCDGFKDGNDPACRVTCVDDPFERNDNKDQAPMVELGSHKNLVSCPGNEDWFAVRVDAHHTLLLTVNYRVGAVLDVDVYKPRAEALQASATEREPGVKGVAIADLEAGIYPIRIRNNSNARVIYDLHLKVE